MILWSPLSAIYTVGAICGGRMTRGGWILISHATREWAAPTAPVWSPCSIRSWLPVACVGSLWAELPFPLSLRKNWRATRLGHDHYRQPLPLGRKLLSSPDCHINLCPIIERSEITHTPNWSLLTSVPGLVTHHRKRDSKGQVNHRLQLFLDMWTGWWAQVKSFRGIIMSMTSNEQPFKESYDIASFERLKSASRRTDMWSSAIDCIV